MLGVADTDEHMPVQSVGTATATKKSRLRGTAHRRGTLEAGGAVCAPLEAGPWGRMHRLMLSFTEREGHCDVPSKHEEQGTQLGRWLNKQRQAYKGGTLELRRLAALEAAGVVWDVKEAEWQRMHGLLLAFKEREGHCDAKAKHDEQGSPLGMWLSKQRVVYKRGTLEPRRVAALEAAGVVWGPLEAGWGQMLGLLLTFKEREGHCDVPCRHEEQGDQLGGWVDKQRQAWKRGTLELYRVQILEESGVRWTVR